MASSESAHIALLNLTECVGVDLRRHFCLSWSDVTLCGVKIKSKKGHAIDLRQYDCGHCDNEVDLLVEEEDRELRELP